MTVRYGELSIRWLGYACVRVETQDETIVYTDPGRYGTLDGTWQDRYGGLSHPSGPPYEERDGDLVLITHGHHYASDAIRRVARPDATVVLFEGIDTDLINDDTRGMNVGRRVEPPEALPFDVRRVGTGESVSVHDVAVDVIPAFNHEDGDRLTADGMPMHPKGRGCGYRFTMDEVPVFWPGDSDLLAAQRALDVSVFLPSIEGAFTMDREEAADLAVALSPDLVVPIHYNTFEELRADSQAFAADVASRSIPVALDECWS